MCRTCGKKHQRFKNGKLHKMCPQKGGSKAIAAGATRGAVAVARKGLSYIPGGNVALKAINPVFDKGLKQLTSWEKGLRPIDMMSKKQKKAASNAYHKKTKGKEPRRKKARMLLERLNRGSFRGRWGPTQEKIMKDGGYRKRGENGYTMLHMTSKW